MKFLNKYIKKYWIPFCLAVLCLTIEAACDLMQPTIMSKIIDIGVRGRQMNYVFQMGLIMIGVTILGAIAAVSRNILASNVSQRFGTELRADLYKKIQTLSSSSIDKYDGASLVTRLTNDLTQVQNFVNGLMRIFVKAPLLCIGSLVMAVRLNAHMSLIFFAVIPVVALLIFMNLKIGYPFFTKIQTALDKVNGVMREYLAGVRVVKAFNRFKYEKKRFKDANEDLSALSTKAMRLMAVFSPMNTLVINLGIVAIVWIGGVRVSNGNMQVGQIIAFINYMTQILFSLTMISFVFTMFIRAKVSAERIGQVLREEDNDINANTIKNELKQAANVPVNKIEFNNVSFSYLESLGEPVLKNVTFSCRSGETIGIIGSTGSGKSTIVSLITGFYKVKSGNINIDGINASNMNVKKLRDKIAIVPQKIVLFSGTVLANIKWGKENAKDDEIKKAAEIAEAHQFIEKLPEGYNTVLGQGGVNLSGGQKQRVSIARALVKKPEILILDDCTSAVDVITESKIRRGLKEYFEKLTCIIIAQRISSVMDADKIIVLDNGTVVGQGRHEELIKNCEVYRDIFRSQVGEEMTSDGK